MVVWVRGETVKANQNPLGSCTLSVLPGYQSPATPLVCIYYLSWLALDHFSVFQNMSHYISYQDQIICIQQFVELSSSRAS